MIRRYVLPAFVMLASVGLFLLISRTGARDAISGIFAIYVLPGLYGLACLWWIVAALFDRRRLIWRLLLIWAPAIAPIALLVSLTPTDTDSKGEGFGFVFVLGPVFLICLSSLGASILTPFYGGVRADRT